MEMEKYRLYVATFPTQWAKQFISVRGFTDATSYDSINEYMEQQKEEADKTKKKKKKVTTENTLTKETERIEITASIKLIAKQGLGQHPSEGNILMQSTFGVIAT